MINKDSDDYKAGFYDGYQEAKKAQDYTKIYPTIPFPINSGGCPVCGRIYENAMHYVCNNWNCPSKVTVTSYGSTNFGAVGASGGGKSEYADRIMMYNKGKEK